MTKHRLLKDLPIRKKGEIIILDDLMLGCKPSEFPDRFEEVIDKKPKIGKVEKVSIYEMREMMSPGGGAFMLYTDNNPEGSIKEFDKVKDEWVERYKLLILKK